MKARRKGTNNPFKTVEKIQLKDSDILYDANIMEFEQDVIPTHDTLSTELKTFDQINEEKHWQDVHERAAIAAMQGMLANPELMENTEWDGRNYRWKIEQKAVLYADALIEELKKRN